MPNADRLIEIFNEAKGRPAGPERERFLAEVCPGDPELKEQVISLLRAHEGAGDFLKETMVVSTALVTEKPGDKIDRYKLLQQLGEGGCGVVYMAEQTEPVRRKVALKVLKMGMDTKRVVARFEAERQALALMDHPNIAKVFDAGATHTGRPYFVMELVRGIKITDYCNQNNLSTTERLDLFIQVCQAVQHAHQKGIIHRDIKPSNILVAQHDTVAVPKVIDFGIAKATSDQPLTDKTLFTAFEQFMGTPAYMSPEQAQLSGLDIDTRTDIYSLGVLLYELLTGQPPFDPEELMKAGVDAMRKTIREKEPPRPSTRLTQELVAADVRRRTSKSEIRNPKPEMDGAFSHRLLQVKELIPLLRGDLDWIVMKCLEKERTRRYETANGLAADLKRHLSHEPVAARPPSRTYRFRKLVRRNKLAFAAASAVAGVLVLGAAVSTWQAFEASRARDAEKEQRLAALTERDKAQTAQKEAERAQQAENQERLRVDVEKTAAQHHLYVADMEVAQQAWEAGNFARAKELVEAHRQSHPDLRGFEWRYLWKLCRGDDEYVLGRHAHMVRGVTFSPDGGTVAARSADYLLKVWDVATRQCRFTLPDVRWGTAFLSDGKSLLVGGHTQVRLVDMTTGEMTTVIEDAGQLVSLLDDGQTVVTTDTNHVVRLWDLPTRQERVRIPGVGGPNPRIGDILKVCVSQDGKHLAVIERGEAYPDEGITIWDVGTQRPVIKLPDQRELVTMRFSPDNRRLAVGDWAGTLKVWNLDSTNEPPLIRAHSSVLQHVVFSPDGRVMATCASDQTIKLWSIADEAAPRLFATLRGHEGPIHALCFSPDGSQLASGSRDQTARIWKLDHIQSIDVAPGVFDNKDGEQGLHFLPDSKTLVGASGNGVKIWDTKRMQLSAVLPGENSVWRVTADGKGIQTIKGANAAGERSFRLWDLQTRTVVKEWPRTGMLPVASRVVSSPDGQIIALGNSQGAIQFWDASGWRELALRTNHTKRIRSLIFTRDGATLFSSSDDGTVRVWDMKALETVTVLGGTRLQQAGQALSPDEQTLAVGSADTHIYLWDWRRRKLLATLKGHRQTVYSVDFSPDGRTLASGSSDGTVKLWNVALRREIATLKLDTGGEPLLERIYWIGFSPDGNMLAARTYQGTLKVWRAASWDEIAATENAKKQ